MKFFKPTSIRFHRLLKSINPHHPAPLSSSPKRRLRSPFSRPFCSNSEHSDLVHTLISIFTKSPFHPQNPQLDHFRSNLNPSVVETVLKNLKSWKIALAFFNWAKNQIGYTHNCYAFNEMASHLSRARQKSPMKLLASELLNSRIPITPAALGFFIRCLGSTDLVHEANSVFDQFKTSGLCLPNTYTYACLLESISKSSDIALMEVRLREMTNLGLNHDKYTLTPVLHCYCNAGKFEEALLIFNEMHDRGMVDSHVLSILAISFSKWKEVDKAFELIRRMENLNIRLNEKTYCVLIHGFVRESRVDKALELFQNMKKLGFVPDISIYDVLIQGLCKNREIEKGLDLFMEMKQSGITPDVKIIAEIIPHLNGEKHITQLLEQTQVNLDRKTMILLFNSCLKCLVNKESIDKAYNLLRSSMGGESDTEFDLKRLFGVEKFDHPDTTSFEIVINGLCKNNKLDLALTLFKDMDQFYCKKNLLLYNNLVSLLSKSDRLDECYLLLNEMKLLGLKPTEFTRNSIYECLCRREDVLGALDLAREMRSNGQKPWIKHTSLLVDKLSKRGKPFEASKFLSDIADEGFTPDIIVYSSAIDGFFKIQQPDQALSLFQQIRDRGYCPDVIAYNIIINGLCNAKRVKQANDVFNEMVNKGGVVPSVATYNSLIDGCFKTNNIDLAVSILSKMEEEEKKPNLMTYTMFINGFCNAGRSDDAIRLWEEAKKRDVLMNRVCYMSMINGMCKCGRMEEALAWLGEMEEKEMKPDAYIYVGIVDAILSSGFDPVLALGVLDKMVRYRIFPDSNDKNFSILRGAIFKLCEDSRTSSMVKNLVNEKKILFKFDL